MRSHRRRRDIVGMGRREGVRRRVGGHSDHRIKGLWDRARAEPILYLPGQLTGLVSTRGAAALPALTGWRGPVDRRLPLASDPRAAPAAAPTAPTVAERRLRMQELLLETWSRLQGKALRDEEAIVAAVAEALRATLGGDPDVVYFALDEASGRLEPRWRFGPRAAGPLASAPVALHRGVTELTARLRQPQRRNTGRFGGGEHHDDTPDE